MLKLFPISCDSFVKKIDNENFKSLIVDSPLKGKGVSISIIGTGLPIHENLINIVDFDAMVGKKNFPNDKFGCSSILSSFLTSTHKDIKGMCPQSELLFAKAFNDKGEGDSASVIASILWSIVKGADLIVLPFISDVDFKPLHEAIRKAYENGIIVISLKEKNMFPSEYKEVISVSCHVKEKFSINYKNGLNINIPSEGVYSFCGNKFFYGFSEYVGLGIATGAIALSIEEAKNNKSKNAYSFVKRALKQEKNVLNALSWEK